MAPRSSLTVVHAGKAKREKFTLTRELVRVETVLGDRRKTDDHWDFIYDAKNSIGYIRITALQPRHAEGASTRRWTN